MGILIVRVLSKLKSLLIRSRLLVLFILMRKNIAINFSFNIGPGFNIFFSGSAFKIYIQKFFSARSNFSIMIEKEGLLEIGSCVFYNNNCSLSSMGRIKIGDNCLFGENVHIYDHNHKYDHLSLTNQNDFAIGSVNIGNNVWVGSNVVILKGVTIGNNVVIGANNLIYFNVADNSVVLNNSTVCIKR